MRERERERERRRNAYRIVVGKIQGKSLLGRLKRRWAHNIKINLT
jgi:hypothetical protein